MSSDEPGVYIMSDLYEIEASSAVAPRGHLENWALNFVRQIDIGCRRVLGFFHILFGLASAHDKRMKSAYVLGRRLCKSNAVKCKFPV